MDTIEDLERIIARLNKDFESLNAAYWDCRQDGYPDSELEDLIARRNATHTTRAYMYAELKHMIEARDYFAWLAETET